MPKRIAVIGAGATGMTATKACLEQGFDVVVFERTNYTGGLWRYQAQLDEDGTASVMRSTIINSSKEMSAFSDFPPPAEYPNYMHNTKMVAYFDLYAAKFNFTQYVRFRHEIIAVEQAADFEETGRWRVRVKNLDSQQTSEELFDGVMICTGHHGKTNMPSLRGQEQFKGTVMHTHSLKHAKGFEEKNVVVVGIGNSGGDAAVELSVVAKQVYLSSRRGCWLTHRLASNGLPLDHYFHRRILTFLFRLLPFWLNCTIFEWYVNESINHELYQLKPRHRIFSQHIMVNDALPNRILSGTVTVKGDIDYLTEDGVVFKGETTPTPCDVLILATGYQITFPFLSDTLLPVTENVTRLYKHQFLPKLSHPQTLAIIGLVQPLGAILPIAELQARWFALLNASKLRLPSASQMLQDIKTTEDRMRTRYYSSTRHTIQVDWLDFMNSLAQKVGVYPPLWKYLVTDWQLFKALIFGPSAPYQFRLVGPNSWSGARDAMLSVKERIRAPLRTNSGRKRSKNWVTNLSIGQVGIWVGLFGWMALLVMIWVL